MDTSPKRLASGEREAREIQLKELAREKEPSGRRLLKLLGAKPVGNAYMCSCPGPDHDDKNPSCRLWVGDNRILYWQCYAGCTYWEIAKILGDNRRYVVDFEPGDDPADWDDEDVGGVDTDEPSSRPNLYLVGGRARRKKKKTPALDSEKQVQVREHVLDRVERLKDSGEADPDSGKGKRLQKMVHYAAKRHGAPADPVVFVDLLTRKNTRGVHQLVLAPSDRPGYMLYGAYGSSSDTGTFGQARNLDPTADSSQRWRSEKAHTGLPQLVVSEGVLPDSPPPLAIVVTEGTSDGFTVAFSGGARAAIMVRGAGQNGKVVKGQLIAALDRVMAIVESDLDIPVIVAGDRDEAGEKFNQTFSRMLTEEGYEVHTLDWENIPADYGDDLTDIFQEGDAETLQLVLSESIRLVEPVPSSEEPRGTALGVPVIETDGRHGLPGTIDVVDCLAQARAADGWVATPVENLTEKRFVVFENGNVRAFIANKWVPGKGEDPGHVETELISRWVAFQSAIVYLVAPSFEDGAVSESIEKAIDVTVLSHTGQSATVLGLSPREADRIQEVVATANLRVAIPETVAGIRKVENLARTLGTEQTQVQLRFTRGGFVAPVGEARRVTPTHMFVTPAGSVTATQVVPDVRVTGRSQNEARRFADTSLGRLGITQLPEDPRAAFKMVPAALTITPEDRHIMVAIIGTLFAAPLGLSINGVPYVEGRKGTGKTLLALVALAMMSDLPMDVSKLPIAFTSSSRSGVQRIHEVLAFLLVIGDDYRRENVADRDFNRATEAVAGHVQAGYGAANDAKSTASREMAAVAPTAANSMVTAEVDPSSEAVSSRSILLQIGPDTVSTKGPDNAYDLFKARYAGGPGGELFTLFVSHLCALMDEHEDGMVGVHAAAEEYRAQWARTYTAGRASDTVSSVATGWHYLRQLARKYDAEDLLPTEGEIDAHLDTLVEGNLAEAEAVDVGRRLLEGIGAAISDGEAHLLDLEGNPPEDYLRFGWAMRSLDNDYERDRGPSFIPKGFRAGYITGGTKTPDEDRRVIISKSTVQRVWKTVFNTRQAPSTREVERALADHVVPQHGAISVFTRPSFPGFSTRPRGVLLTLETLGLDTPTQAANATPTGSQCDVDDIDPEDTEEF